MTTVLFVHGTGVRQPAYDASFGRFAARLAEIRPGFAVAPCYWGGPHGSRLNAAGASIPSGDSARGIDGDVGATAFPRAADALTDESVVDDEAEVVLWGLLERDPLFELRVLRTDGAMEELPPNAPPAGRQLAAAAQRLVFDAALAARLDTVGLGRVFPLAVETVLGSDPGRNALRREAVLGGTLRTALARALVAEATLRADEELGGSLPLDGGHRDELVTMIVAGLGGSDRGLGASLGRVGLNVALRLGVTKPVERRRAAIIDAAAPASGDVLMYLARGEPIRGFIGDAVTAAAGPVVIVAHSLGGVASLELLATRTLPSVRMLVTVGSQAPLLYELNALPALEFGAGLPPCVPPWVNVFDRRDLLAYAGAEVFPGRVEDRAVDNAAPFPRAHSAYFTNKRFYAVLDEVLP